MAAVVLVNIDTQADILLQNKNKIQKGEEYERQVRTFLKLLGTKEQAHRNSSILLKGYVYHHKETCNLEECPLKREKYIKHNTNESGKMDSIMVSANQVDKSSNLKSTKQRNMNYIAEQYDVLIEYANKIYSDGVARFPDNAALHISYAFFLLEFKQSRHLAIEELNVAEEKKPLFD